jgi:hypothetical protein
VPENGMQTVPVSDVIPPDVPRAADGFSLNAQPFGVQQQFVQVFGVRAWQEWVNEHNAQIHGGGAALAASPASTVAPAPAGSPTTLPAPPAGATPATPAGATPAAAAGATTASPVTTPLLAPSPAAGATTTVTPSVPGVPVTTP